MTAPTSALPRIAGHPTHVMRSGRGARRALFIHCTLGRSGTWSGVQAALGHWLAMTAFDRPGHGRSAVWDGQGGALGLHTLTTRIAAALLDGPADLVGHSYGATVALRLAMEQPERVRSLTLIEPPLFKLAENRPDYPGHEAAMMAVDAALARGENEQAAQLFQDAVSPDTPWSCLPERARRRLAGQIERVAEERGVTRDDAPGLTAPGRIEAVRQKVLLIEGSASPQLLCDVQSALASRLAGARRAVIAGAGHMAPLTHPEAVADEIAAFLKLG